jgi:N-acyl-D-aspartate/D-glutamate deacylase
MINFIMDEAEVQGVLGHRLSMIGSDGTAVSPEIYEGKPHPRYYGCFPRVLGHYCRELKLFDLETAVHKMTGMQAEQLALPSRGLLRESFAADVVLLDFEKVIDRATFDDPHQYPDGISTVIVNGQIVVHGGEHRGAKPGQVLRPERA